MKSLYTIFFADNTNFRGGTIENSNWLNVPDKEIKRIIYSLPNGDNIVLNGYESYFHMTEAVTDISGKNKGKQRIEFDYIMGKKREIITSYRINVLSGEIEKKIFNEEDKFIRGLNSCGWKPNIK